MKTIAIFLLTSIAAILFAGCATQQASTDAGRERTSYTVPSDNANMESEETVWQMDPALSP